MALRGLEIATLHHLGESPDRALTWRQLCQKVFRDAGTVHEQSALALTVIHLVGEGMLEARRGRFCLKENDE